MRHSKRSLSGYLMVDHRFSPGDSRVPEGTVMEADVIPCAHCHKLVMLNPERQRERHHCSRCDQYVCDTPACLIECRNLNQFMDRLQEEGALLLNIQEV